MTATQTPRKGRRRLYLYWDWDGSVVKTDHEVHRPSWNWAATQILLERDVCLDAVEWDKIQTAAFGLPEPLAAEVMAMKIKEHHPEAFNGDGVDPEVLSRLRMQYLTEKWDAPYGDISLIDGVGQALELAHRNLIVTSSCALVVAWMAQKLGVQDRFPHDFWITAEHPALLPDRLWKPKLNPWQLAKEKVEATEGDLHIPIEDSVVMAVELSTCRLFDYIYLVVHDDAQMEDRHMELQRNSVDLDKVRVVRDLRPLVQFMQAH